MATRGLIALVLGTLLFAVGCPTDKPYAVSSAFEPLFSREARAAERTESPELSDEEGEVREKLEQQLSGSTPTHRLWLSDGRQWEGILVYEDESSIVLKQNLDGSNFSSVQWLKKNIEKIERLPKVEITRADILLQKEFPAFKFIKRPPYSIATDEPYSMIENSLRILERLHEEFLKTFAGLIERQDAAQSIQIVFFGNQAEFRRYVAHRAPHLESASGFYASDKNRLVLFNQLASEKSEEIRKRIEELRQQWLASDSKGTPDQIKEYLASLQNKNMMELKEHTYMAMRHEEAHQLFHSYGILPSAAVRNMWLIEGLAQYCETPFVGRFNAPRASNLRKYIKEGRLINIKELVNYRDEQGFFRRGTAWAEVAYAQSWALVYFLMGAEYREGFFKHLRFTRDPAHQEILHKEDMTQILAEHLGLPWPEIQARWTLFLQKL